MNFDDLQAMQNDIHRLHTRNQELEAENAALNIELMNMDDQRKIAESDSARLQKWNDDCVAEGARLLKENDALRAALTRIAGMTGNDRDVQVIAEDALKGGQS